MSEGRGAALRCRLFCFQYSSPGPITRRRGFFMKNFQQGRRVQGFYKVDVLTFAFSQYIFVEIAIV